MRENIPVSIFLKTWENTGHLLFGRYKQYGLEQFLSLLGSEDRVLFFQKLNDYFETKKSS